MQIRQILEAALSYRNVIEIVTILSLVIYYIRRRYAASRFVVSRVRILLGASMFVSCVSCMLYRQRLLPTVYVCLTLRNQVRWIRLKRF